MFRKKSDTAWYQVSVPGTVHTDLLNNKLIADPFYGGNEKNLQWIEKEEWEYRADFTLSTAELLFNHIEMDFKGLDTYADVYLNDSLVMATDNMFREWRIDIMKYVRKGKNKLNIVFHSAVERAKELAGKLPYTLPGEERVFTRKAQYQFGWDFAPRLVTCGIWKDINLVFWSNAKIESIHYKIDTINDVLAKLHFNFKIISDTALSDYYLLTQCKNEKDVKQPIQLKKGLNYFSKEFIIYSPHKWWSNGLGQPDLYYFTCSVNDPNKKLVDKKKITVGLRTIELVQDKDSIGKSFYFKLNGVPIFMKGANYIPPDVFLSRVSKEKYDLIVDQAAEGNMNMLRVWGGGVYADDEFYNECDRKGILVWQDFMFACGMYPGDSSFIKNVKQEVNEVVDRLQNHPCLALWCGNNENKEGWYNWDWQQQYKYSAEDSLTIWKDYQELFENNIPAVLRSNLIDEKNYISSSPAIGWGHKESLVQGDSHYWGVWWNMEPFEIYTKRTGRFMSEYGFQSLSSIQSIHKFTNEASLNSLKLKNHQKHPTGFQTIQEYLERDYKTTAYFPDYVYISQLLQADGMATAIESHRRAMPNCMGTLFWQLNDCWPSVSWSSIDYYGIPKAVYYRAKELYNTIILSVIQNPREYSVYIISDSLKPVDGKLKLRIMDFSGSDLWNKEINVTVLPNSSKVYYEIPAEIISKFDSTKIVLEASFQNREKLFYFSKPKNLALEKNNVSIKIISDTTITVTTDKLAKNIYLENENLNFSDNYFDLLPGESKIVKYKLQRKSYKLNNVNLISVKSLYDVVSK